MQIRKACEQDIQDIEAVLLDAVRWLTSFNKRAWSEEDVAWHTLSQTHTIDQFYVVEEKGEVVATFLLCDADPIYWPEIKPGQSLYIHKLCVMRKAAKSMASLMIMDYFKAEGRRLKKDACRLDCRTNKPELKHFYEKHGFQLVDEGEIVKGYCTSRYMYQLDD